MKGKQHLKIAISAVLISVTIFFGFHSATSLAESNSNEVTATAEKSITAQEIASMNAEQLQQLNREIDRLTVEADLLIHRGHILAGDRADVLQKLGRIEVQESVDLLIKILAAESKRPVDRKNRYALQGPDMRVIYEGLDALKKVGTQQEVRTKDGPGAFEAIYTDIQSVIIQDGFKGAMGIFFPHRASLTRSALHDRDLTLPSLTNVLHSNRGDNTGIAYLEKVEKWLHTEIFDDDPLIARLMEMVGDSFLEGPSNRRIPDKLYLMGSSGTGKTNGAKSLTNALFQDPEAWKTHMFRLPVLKNPYDEAQIMGATVGLIGSDKLPAFLKFLEQHSDGKLLLVSETTRDRGTTHKFVMNPEYKGQTLPGYYPPWMAVILLDEFHDVSEMQKNGFYKMPIEDGTFTLSSPNGGEDKVTVPANFIVASNEGAELIAGRDVHEGQSGKPQTYEQLLRRWEAVSENEKVLMDAILATNQMDRMGGQTKRGISAEMLNRFVGSLHIMKPASPLRLRLIVEDLLKKFTKSQGSHDSLMSKQMGQVEFTWDPEIARIVQEYDYNAELMARPIQQRFRAMVRRPLLAALRAGKFEATRSSKVHVSIVDNEDLSKSLRFEVTPSADEGAPYSFDEPIPLTFKDRKKPPISDSRIDEIIGLGDRLRKNVFGMDNLVGKITDWIINTENEMNSDKAGEVKVLFIDGLSSTGKSQLAKELHKVLAENKEELPVFDFSKIRTEQDVEKEILGYTDPGGNVVKSRFMKLYDFHQGRIVVEFGEMANSNPKVLQLLYSLFRDPYVQFADGVSRSMNKVTIIVTGNSTLKEYLKVPVNVPLHVRMAAYDTIYQNLSSNWMLFFSALAKDYPIPLLNRFGSVNSVVSRPHTFKSLRQLAQLKLGEALNSLKMTDSSKRGWTVLFANADEYKRFIDTVIDDGFKLDEQGASIDNYIKAFQQALNGLLLREKVAPNSQVVLRFNKATDNRLRGTRGHVVYDVVTTKSAQPLQLSLDRPYVEPEVEPSDTETILTGWHEAGHDVVNRALFADAYSPVKVSIVPGVDMIGEDWIFYQGVAVRDHMKQIPHNREFIVRTMAVLLAGHVGEMYASGDHSAGKSNDIERAAMFARDAILRYGLEENWGIDPIPAGSTVESYYDQLTDAKKAQLHTLRQEMMKEAQSLAEQAFLANKHVALKLANYLVESRELNAEQLKAFYAENHVVDPTAEMSLAKWMQKNPKSPMEVNPKFPREIWPSLERPKKIANLAEYLRAQQQLQYDQVPLPENLPVVKAADQDCSRLLTSKN